MDQSPTSGLITLNKWLVVLFAILMVVTAALAGNGIYKSGDMPWLVTGHMHLGNTLFFLAVIQIVISFVLYSRKQTGIAVLGTSALVMLLTFTQIGLGYSTRSNLASVAGWHIALGVALTATIATLATLLWLNPRPRQG